MQTITIQTSHKTEVIRVTDLLADMVRDVEEGLAFFSVPHTTAALILCEDDDELRDDLIKVAQKILAPMRPFKHIRKNNPNAEAHIFSALAGTSLVMAIENGRFNLGTYQNILLLELDGPKSREIRCKVIKAHQNDLSG